MSSGGFKAVAAGAVVTLSLLTGCAQVNALNVNLIPLPGSTYSSGYDLVIEFASVLNLPDRAKVLMDGTKIGVVKDIALSKDGVDVVIRIDGDVVVPANIHAVIQQATVLGDTYVALEMDPADTRSPQRLADGGRISIDNTKSPPQIEDTMSNLANFIGSGSIQRAQSAVIGINRITPPTEEIKAISARVAVDLADLSNNIEMVDQWLNGLAQAAQVMGSNSEEFRYWFSDRGVMAFHHSFSWTHFFAPLLPTIGSIYWNGYWLVPLLNSLGGVFETIQHSKWVVEDEFHQWRRLITDQMLPEQKHPAINIVSVVGPDGAEMLGNVDQILRLIGAMQ